MEKGKHKLIICLIITILFTRCASRELVMLPPVPTSTAVLLPESEDWYEVYFSSPGEDSYQGGVDETLAEAIDRARFRVDLAAYDFNLWSLRSALIRAHQRGVSVRVVAEGDHLSREEFQDLIEAGIPVIPDPNPGLMHDKLILMDSSELWMGSMNFTLNGVYRHDNHLLRIYSIPLVENYRMEFEEMFENQLFGTRIQDNTPHPVVVEHGSRIETFFSPDDQPRQRIEEVLAGADQSIEFLAFSFTSDSLAEIILERAARGVRVRGVFDQSQISPRFGAEYARFKEEGVDVCQDGSPEKMHHKLILVDGEIVITGSYNLTESAEKENDENLLIIHNARMAEIFQAEFERISGLCR